MKTVIQKRRVIAGLKRAKNRLTGKWCQGSMATDKLGNPVSIETRGCRCCIEGAIHLAVMDVKWSNHLLSAIRRAAIKALPSKYRDNTLACYNDAPRRTEKQVLALFDRAIAKLEAT